MSCIIIMAFDIDFRDTKGMFISEGNPMQIYDNYLPSAYLGLDIDMNTFKTADV